MRWIDIKKELPNIGQMVLVALREEDSGRYFIRNASLLELTFEGRGIWSIGGNFFDNQVTHWMPLPDPPDRRNQDEMD